MNDTEILDYLQQSYTNHRTPARDVQIGRVAFTIGLRPGTLRELIMAGIQADQQRTVNEIADELTRR